MRKLSPVLLLFAVMLFSSCETLPQIFDCPAVKQKQEKQAEQDKKAAAGKMRGKPCRLKEGANWRREWELNPPEPVLQTVALAARPSRHCCALRLLYPRLAENSSAEPFFLLKNPADGLSCRRHMVCLNLSQFSRFLQSCLNLSQFSHRFHLKQVHRYGIVHL